MKDLDEDVKGLEGHAQREEIYRKWMRRAEMSKAKSTARKGTLPSQKSGKTDKTTGEPNLHEAEDDVGSDAETDVDEPSEAVQPEFDPMELEFYNKHNLLPVASPGMA